ncbi:MAG TPA: helix-turn-helix domain-containing protein, partial [Smithella sp.]|nr:helix-turn-helix domain-containing protein [Smithella sp.]
MFIEQTPSDNSQKLKMKRESLGLSPGDVFKKIRIRTRYIEAIENSEFDELPDPVYTKNFIKTYARFLNIDENPVLQDYDAYLNAHREEQTPPPEPPPETKSFFSSFAATKNYWGILIVLIIFISIWLILKQNQSV